MSEKLNGPCVNTDRELWREPPGDFYANSVHVTESGGLGINVGGTVIVKSLRAWHEAAKEGAAAEERGRRRGVEDAAKAIDAKRTGTQGDDTFTTYYRGGLADAARIARAALAPRDSAPGTIGGTMTDEEARRRSTFDAQLAEVGCEPLASAHVRCNCYARIQGARVAHARTCPMWTATIALDIEATLACSRDAERILGERLKEAREILADCRRFIASADLLRRIDASISQGDLK